MRGRFTLAVQLLGALSMGANGAVGSTYNLNYMIPIYNNVIESYKSGDMSTALASQNQAVQLVQLLLDYNQFGGANKVRPV